MESMSDIKARLQGLAADENAGSTYKQLRSVHSTRQPPTVNVVAALGEILEANGLARDELPSNASQVTHLELFLFNYPKVRGH
jgi:hypothetical protein